MPIHWRKLVCQDLCRIVRLLTPLWAASGCPPYPSVGFGEIEKLQQRKGIPGGTPLNSLEAPPGFEPGMKDLQSSALPLGYGAGCGGDREGRPTYQFWLGRAAFATPLSRQGAIYIMARPACTPPPGEGRRGGGGGANSPRIRPIRFFVDAPIQISDNRSTSERRWSYI